MSPTPPGPAALLAEAIATSAVTSNGGSPQPPTRQTPVSEDPASDLKLDPSSASATTTIITKQAGDITTDTFTYVGASAVSTKLSSNGSVLLRPIPARGLSSSNIKSHRTHTFLPRTSHFDRLQEDPFRGFYTLFWIGMAVAAARTGVWHYSQWGVIWGLSFATLISEDAKMLALSDAVMVGSTFLAIPFVKMLNRGWIRYYWKGAILQHILQTGFLALAVRWTFYREWPWVQSGFMTLHTISTLMKVHSYCSHNGELSEKARELGIKEVELEKIVAANGGHQKVQAEGRAEWERQVEKIESPGETDEVKEMIPVHQTNGSARGKSERKDAESSDSGIRRRRSSSRKHSTKLADDTAPTMEEEPEKGLEVLTWHPNAQISQLAVGVLDLKESLVSTGVNKMTFPDNVTFYNFLDYLLVPTLVYQLEYPRTDKIRPLYVVEKVLATFGVFSLLVLIVEHYILPISPSTHENSFLTSALDLAMPFMICYLLIFYIIFEAICNVFAELTRFADREFYKDWWNSKSFDEFSRKWNVPVHQFLLRHVYSSTITTYKFSKFQAAFTTFLLSACVHELVMAVVTKKIRFYLLTMQMCQLPMIYIGGMPIMKRYPALGNLFFWLGLLSGFPLLAVAYIRF